MREGVPVAEVTPSIGARLRILRVASGRSLASVAEAVGISSSALSQIETGVMQPSVNRLIEIVGEIGTTVSEIFEDYETLRPKALSSGVSQPIPGVQVMVAGADEEAHLGQGVVYRRLSPVALEGVDLFETLYPPKTSSSVDGAMLRHSGYEMGAVTSGSLSFEFTEGTVQIDAGGSIAFWATRPHRVVNDSDAPARATWLTLRNRRQE